jgi:hypothetical protein
MRNVAYVEALCGNSESVTYICLIGWGDELTNGRLLSVMWSWNQDMHW